jgi:hypothetical protein
VAAMRAQSLGEGSVHCAIGPDLRARFSAEAGLHGHMAHDRPTAGNKLLFGVDDGDEE